MELSHFIERIGRDKYERACRSAWTKPQTYSESTASTDSHSDVAHDLSDEICYSDLAIPEKLRLIFELFERIPCYAALFYLTHLYGDMSSDNKNSLWAAFRKYLSDHSEYLANPVGCTLWCDYFEDPDGVQDAWDAIVLNPINDLQVKRVLDASGPVPWKFKVVLFRVLLADVKWHYYIFLSIYHSKHDVYGKIDKEEAKRVLDALDLPDETSTILNLKNEFE